MRTAALIAAAVLVLSAASAPARARTPTPATIRHTVDHAARDLMARNGIPGLAIAVTADGRSHVYTYGVASRETGRAVSTHTLFEIGSISKTFTATLAAFARGQGKLSLTDTVERYLPVLAGTPFGRLRLLVLGTHTPGGLPLQVPGDIHDRAQLMTYLRAWEPTWPPGTRRTYNNISIGMLGLVTARAMHGRFDTLMQDRLFPALGLHEAFIDVPADRRGDYAQGYTRAGKPIRMAPGVLASEAYGVRITAPDLLRFVEANMHMLRLDPVLQRAIDATHVGYFTAGPMTQDLIWEQYPWPASLATLRTGNAPAMIYDAVPATRITPPRPPAAASWINKTGSTNGFSAYVAFIPARRLGIVILANRNIPIIDRIDAAHAILTDLGGH